MVHAFDRVEDWRAARARAGGMLLALDFDGTLAPIVPIPADAALLPAAQSALRALVARADTRVAVVSGRALADVRARVGLAGVYYAGNHGLEIEGPDIERIHPEAVAAVKLIADCTATLRGQLAEYPGVLVEDKHLTLSVHFRMVSDPALEEEIVARVMASCGDRAGLRLTAGKKVVEVRPDVAWDKGRATRFLVDAVLARNGAAPVVYIGDDRTDEDAFRALRGRGDGVIVADPAPAESAAGAWVRSPAEVATVIAGLARTG